MPVEHQENAIEKGLLTLWIIWAAIMGSLLIYVFICHQFGDELRRDMGQNIPLPLMRNILYGIAIITLFLTHFMKRFLLGGTFGNTLSKSIKSGQGSNQPRFLAKYSTALIVSLGLSESIGIYGFVLFLLGADFQTLYIFIGVSALAIFAHRPKREEIETLAIAMKTEETPIAED
jgi:F0F1-type ATP synthase membrane subunit c/vacuolar-type H+-ATPase subunit K